MTQHQVDNDYFENALILDEVDLPHDENKRKRLAHRIDHPTYALAERPRHHIADVMGWLVIGTVGVCLTIGSIIVASDSVNGESWVMLIPLVYMIFGMIFMRRR